MLCENPSGDSRKDFSLDIGLSHRKEINTDYQKMSDVILFYV